MVTVPPRLPAAIVILGEPWPSAPNASFASRPATVPMVTPAALSSRLASWPSFTKTTAGRVDTLRARLIQLHPYELPEIIGREMDIDTTFRAVWKPIDEFGAGKSILYPTGLLELLK